MQRPLQVTMPDPDGAGPLGAPVTKNTYDIDGLLLQVERATGDAQTPWEISQSVYDVIGRLTKTINPQGHETLFTYDAAGRQDTVTDPEGRVSQTIYDIAGQVLKLKRAVGTPLEQDYATYTYSANGQKLSVADANGNTTLYAYDGYDRLTQATFPDASAELFAYDALGSVTNKTQRDGSHIAFVYDGIGRQKKKSPDNDPNIRTRYDGMGRVNHIQWRPAGGGVWVNKLEYAYNVLGQMTSVTDYTNDAAGKTVSYAYNELGCRTDVIWPDGFKAQTSCDDLARAEAVTLYDTSQTSLGVQALFSYDGLGRRAGLTYPTTAAASYGYEADSALDSLAHAFTSGPAYGAAFEYTAANQVSSEDIINTAVYRWVPEANSATTYAVNNLNQYTDVSDNTASPVAPTYDLRGNLTAYDTEAFIYDTENRLTAYSRTGGSPVEVAYDYDVLGRRAAKTIDPNGATPTITQYLYDGDQVIGEYDGTGTLLRRYAYASGGGIDEPLVFVDESGANSVFYYYHVDARGSIIAMSDVTGVAVETYSYSPYGIASITTPTTGQPYRYTGRRFDAETGMYYYRARYYHPTMGRFLQTDPIGYEDQMNLYAYVNNDPMNMVDPSGLAGSCAEFDTLPVRGSCWEADSTASLDFLKGQGSGIDTSRIVNGGGGTDSAVGQGSWQPNPDLKNAIGEQISQVRTLRRGFNDPGGLLGNESYANSELGGFVFKATKFDSWFSSRTIISGYKLSRVNIRGADGLMPFPGFGQCAACAQKGSAALVIGAIPSMNLNDISANSSRYMRIANNINAPVIVVSNGSKKFLYLSNGTGPLPYP